MELTYLVKGADGKQYGPATLDQLEAWIREGRLLPQAQLQRSDMSYWASAQDFQELQPVFTPPESQSPVAVATPTRLAPQPAARLQADPAAVGSLKSGASWFYWVAGLSLINTIAAYSGSSFHFIFGLGITQVFDGLGQSLAAGGKVVVLVLDLLAAGLLILFGVFANKGHTWAFIVGMVLIALDGLIFVLFQDWLGVGFHAFVLFCLFRGLSACRQLARP